MKYILMGSILSLSACTITEDVKFNEISSTITIPVATSLSTTDETPAKPIPTIAVTAIPLRTSTPIPVSESMPSNTAPAPTTTKISPLLEGPLIAYRVQTDMNYLLLLDLATLTLREVRQEHLNDPFNLNWLDGGCHLYTHGNIIDLHGNIVEKTNDPENEEGHFQVQHVSPDKKMGVREQFMGWQEDVELEYLTLEILDRTDPNVQISLAANGGAYAYAWSPDGKQLAFSDFDKNAILQVYVITLDGLVVEKITSHSEDPGVIQIIEWSPDGQHIAYAAQSLLPNQYTRGGWIGLVSLLDFQTIDITPSSLQYTKGLWWSEDGSRVAFVGESFYDAPEALQGTQIHWADRDSGMILNSFYSEEAPDHFFNMIVPVGNIDTVFFGASSLSEKRDSSNKYNLGVNFEYDKKIQNRRLRKDT